MTYFHPVAKIEPQLLLGHQAVQGNPTLAAHKPHKKQYSGEHLQNMIAITIIIIYSYRHQTLATDRISILLD